MIKRCKQSSTQPPSWVVDQFIETWISWREACRDVRHEYESWRTCTGPQQPVAYASYCAALDREEDAALMHSVWAERIRLAVRG